MDSDDELPDDFIKALIDRYESSELVELLDIPVREILEMFEDYVRDNYEELCEEIGYKGLEDGTESD